MIGQNNSWIGVDLDGTLATYDKWKGIEHIGEPVPLMVKRVKEWLAGGTKVKVFTARVSGSDAEAAKAYIQRWLTKVAGLPELEVTNVKDFGMIELWDDRAVGVQANTGKIKKGAK